MVIHKMRGAAAACSVAAMLLAVPAESNAFEFLDRMFGWGAYRTTYSVAYPVTAYSPVSYAPSCSPCAPSCSPCAPSCSPCVTQTCRYVPQTCYRTVCQRVPVTTFQAVTGCDPCTGCPVTTYRPVTVWTTQTRMVPYTTYRLTYSNPCAVGPACAPCGPSVSTIGTAGSCCSTPSVGVPAPVYTSPGTSMPGIMTPGTMGTPTRTFQNGQAPMTNGPTAEPSPDPNSDATSTSTGPKIFLDRTTSLPIRQTPRFRLISTPSDPAPVHRVEINDAGWRASRD